MINLYYWGLNFYSFNLTLLLKDYKQNLDFLELIFLLLGIHYSCYFEAERQRLNIVLTLSSPHPKQVIIGYWNTLKRLCRGSIKSKPHWITVAHPTKFINSNKYLLNYHKIPLYLLRNIKAPIREICSLEKFFVFFRLNASIAKRVITRFLFFYHADSHILSTQIFYFSTLCKQKNITRP